MTATELQKRNEKSDHLRVLQTDSGQFFVESGEGKILYSVTINDSGDSCTCGDFAKNIKRDPDFKCKHILAVFNAVPKREVEGAVFLEKQIPRLNERFITNIKGKDFVMYAGVLDLASNRGLMKLEVELIQFPTKENGHEAICRAVAEGKNGELFSDIGDANPNNCASMIAAHKIRMASTRAKARCLRDMCNIGICTIEEISDFDEVIGTPLGKPMPKSKPKAAKKPAAKAPKKAPVKTSNPDTPASAGEQEPKKDSQPTTQPQMSEAQKRALYNLSRRRGISVEQLEQMTADAYGCALESLTSGDASAFIRQLQQAA